MKYDEYLLKSFDGTMLNVCTYGEGDKTIVVSNGLGGNFKVFQDIIKDIPGYRFISWDYRGLYKSHAPKNKGDVTIMHHMKDLEVILKKEKVKEAIFMGWSVGGAINIQLYEKRPELFKAMILINPVSKTILKDMVSINRLYRIINQRIPAMQNFSIMYQNELRKIGHMVNIDPVLYQALLLVQRYHKLYSKVLKASSKIPRVATYLKKINILNKNMDDYFFEDIFKEYAKLDMDIYIEIVKDMLQYSEDDILPKMKVPALLISSTRDIFVPRKNIKKMEEMIPDVEYLEVFRGSHYALIEFPEMLSLGIKRFLRKREL